MISTAHPRNLVWSLAAGVAFALLAAIALAILYFIYGDAFRRGDHQPPSVSPPVATTPLPGSRPISRLWWRVFTTRP